VKFLFHTSYVKKCVRSNHIQHLEINDREKRDDTKQQKRSQHNFEAQQKKKKNLSPLSLPYFE
jgi:hypothetical protein